MAFLKTFSIKNFRGFRDNTQILQFGVPVEGKSGSGLTYIVGGNNSGKTSIIEALVIRSEHKIRSSEKHADGPEFILTDVDGTVKRKANLIRPDSNTIMENPALSYTEIFEIIPSRRHWESAAQGQSETQNLLSSSGLNFTRKSQTISTSVILKNIEADEEKYKSFISLVQQVIPEFSKFAIGFEDHEYIEYITGSGTRHTSDFLGDGVISIIRILAHLFNAISKPLIIDEPELSLHPLAQKRLLKLIANYSTKRQIIISTHSPYFVEWEYIKNGAKLNRVVKEEDKECKIFTLKEYSTYSSLLNGANWQQPFLIDVVAKEIFFQENILFLEGQEDVGLLKPFFSATDINIFGYGVRGYDGFEFALQLAQDLGIKKAAVILDSPTEDPLHKEKNENAVAEALRQKFPAYNILQWDKNDIRDKKVFNPVEKVGYFTDKGKLKPAAELGDFESKIQNLKDFFSRQ
jgi:predicted ATP-dependent endonuclease of OLD family